MNNLATLDGQAAEFEASHGRNDSEEIRKLLVSAESHARSAVTLRPCHPVVFLTNAEIICKTVKFSSKQKSLQELNSLREQVLLFVEMAIANGYPVVEAQQTWQEFIDDNSFFNNLDSPDSEFLSRLRVLVGLH